MQVVARDRIVAIVAPDYPCAVGKRLQPADLLSAQWILREQGSGTLSAFEAALTANGISMGALDIALTLPSSEAVRSAIMAGPFATVVSELVVASHLQAGALVRANFKLPPRAFYLLRHTERYKSMASLALERLIDTAVA